MRDTFDVSMTALAHSKISGAGVHLLSQQESALVCMLTTKNCAQCHRSHNQSHGRDFGEEKKTSLDEDTAMQ